MLKTIQLPEIIMSEVCFSLRHDPVWGWASGDKNKTKLALSDDYWNSAMDTYRHIILYYYCVCLKNTPIKFCFLKKCRSLSSEINSSSLCALLTWGVGRQAGEAPLLQTALFHALNCGFHYFASSIHCVTSRYLPESLTCWYPRLVLSIFVNFMNVHAALL